MPDLYFIKKVIILKKIEVTMKSYPPPLFQPFQFGPEMKKTMSDLYFIKKVIILKKIEVKCIWC